MSLMASYLINDQNAKRPTPYKQFLDPKKLDFSLDSLHHIDDYLTEVKKTDATKLSALDIKLIQLRCGAYCGEVIIRNSQDAVRWTTYEDALKNYKELSQFDIERVTQFILVNDKKQTLGFPMGRVENFLSFGLAESLYQYVVNEGGIDDLTNCDVALKKQDGAYDPHSELIITMRQTAAFLYHDEGKDVPTPYKKYLDPKKLDYSLESLHHIDEYLRKVRRHVKELTDLEYIRMQLRAAAYCGEVIIRKSKGKIRWTTYDDALASYESLRAVNQDSVSRYILICEEQRYLSFPVLQVGYFMGDGMKASLYQYAATIGEPESVINRVTYGQPQNKIQATVSEIASYLINDEHASHPTPLKQYLDHQKLDYSLNSLKLVEEYLLQIKKHRKTLTYFDLLRVTLRCGAYCGEVIRRNSKGGYHWTTHDDYHKGKSASVILPKTAETYYILLYKKGDSVGIVTPMVKVSRLLRWGMGDSIYALAVYYLKHAYKD